MDHYTFILLVMLLALVLVNDLIWRRWTDKLLDRIMATDLKEYRYYQDKYHKDVKEVERIREDERIKEHVTAVGKDKDAETLDNLEEPWPKDEM